MDILPNDLQAYLDSHCDPEPEALQQLNRETNLKVIRPHMLSGHYQGRLLSFLSKMIAPKCILEIGTYTGYSAICLAEGLVDGGMLHTIEVNPEMEGIINAHLKLTNVENKIKLYFGPAQQVIIDLQELIFDLVFIDADKKNNFNYFQMIFDQVRPGGIIIIDNVLWKGKVYGTETDSDTENIRKLNNQIYVNNKVEKLILPVRDGLLVIRKK